MPTQQSRGSRGKTQPLEPPRPVSFYAGDATGRRRRDLSAPLAAQFRRVAALVTQYRPRGVLRLRDDDRRGPCLLQVTTRLAPGGPYADVDGSRAWIT